jgi:hypothetical protein
MGASLIALLVPAPEAWESLRFSGESRGGRTALLGGVFLAVNAMMDIGVFYAYLLGVITSVVVVLTGGIHPVRRSGIAQASAMSITSLLAGLTVECSRRAALCLRRRLIAYNYAGIYQYQHRAVEC